MHIVINDQVRISAIQEVFSNMFPYLRIEFFKKRYKSGPGIYMHPGPNNCNVGFYRSGFGESVISVFPSLTVGQLELEFKEKAGLVVQVFRKSGKLWLETTLTKEWTLQQQNIEGCALSDGK